MRIDNLPSFIKVSVSSSFDCTRSFHVPFLSQSLHRQNTSEIQFRVTITCQCPSQLLEVSAAPVNTRNAFYLNVCNLARLLDNLHSGCDASSRMAVQGHYVTQDELVEHLRRIVTAKPRPVPTTKLTHYPRQHCALTIRSYLVKYLQPQA